MDKLVNRIKNMVQRDPHYSVRGPVMQSFKFVNNLGQYMHVLDFEVPAGVRIPSDFGYFVEIERLNTNKGRCFITVAPEEDINGDPTFDEQESFVDNLTEFICKARIVKQLVDKDAAPLTGDTVWESNITYHDEYHNWRETTYILSSESQTSTEWDNQLNRTHEVTTTLTKTKPSTTGLIQTASGPDEYVFRNYQKIRCGWYLVREEIIGEAYGYTYCSNENYLWPAVLQEGPDFGELLAEKDGEDYTAGILLDYRLKEAFSGPCRVDVNVAWSPTPMDCTGVEQLIPESISYQGIFVNFRIPECLHDTFTQTERVGTTSASHPILKDNQTRVISFAATKKAIVGGTAVTVTDWPATIIGSKVSNPYKGGYLNITKTYHSPNV